MADGKKYILMREAKRYAGFGNVQSLAEEIDGLNFLNAYEISLSRKAAKGHEPSPYDRHQAAENATKNIIHKMVKHQIEKEKAPGRAEAAWNERRHQQKIDDAAIANETRLESEGGMNTPLEMSELPEPEDVAISSGALDAAINEDTSSGEELVKPEAMPTWVRRQTKK